MSCVRTEMCSYRHCMDCSEYEMPCLTLTTEDYDKKTNADRIRSMSNDELADFFFESPEIEFEVCEYCKYFGGHTSDTPCKHDMGLCLIPAKNKAFKEWLKQPVV